MSADDKLDELRKHIDTLDEKIQALISERATFAGKVGEAKTAGEGDRAFYRPERESAVLRRVVERNRGPLPDEEMVRLFREIMSACLALEKPLTIAYLGPEGTFTQAAALKHFGHSVETRAFVSIDSVFREVEAGSADYGVVPVENSTEGVITHTLDMFQRSSLGICGEVEVRVHHHLFSEDGKLAKIKRVKAHQQALAQCHDWLNANLPHAERESVTSNAEAARQVRNLPDEAAIASKAAGELYGLATVAENIEDEPDNTTRFLIVGKQAVERSGEDKTSLLVMVYNKPGALFSLLKPIAENDISLTRIESRPSRNGTWEYVFFIDMAGHRDDEVIAATLAALEEEVVKVTVLGSYPRAVI